MLTDLAPAAVPRVSNPCPPTNPPQGRRERRGEDPERHGTRSAPTSLFEIHHSLFLSPSFFPRPYRSRRSARVELVEARPSAVARQFFAPCTVHSPYNSLPLHQIRHHKFARRAHPVRRKAALSAVDRPAV
jgi:hypothetical protein